MTEYTERTIYRWSIIPGLAFNQTLHAVDFATENDDWADWAGTTAHIDFADRNQQVVITFDSDPDAGATGLITFTSGTLHFDISSDVTAALTSTATLGRGKDKAQYTGILYAVDPVAPGEPQQKAYIKLTVKEP